MTEYRKVDYYELCRLCTTNKGTRIHMFREEGLRRQIPFKVQICLRLKVHEQDTLPKLICKACLDKLEGYFDFRSSCENAETMLESYAKNLSINGDFGKVYIRENKLDANKEIVYPTVSTSTHIGTVVLKDKEVVSSQSKKTPVKIPLTLGNIGRIMQPATAILLIPEQKGANVKDQQNDFTNTNQVQQSIEKVIGQTSHSYESREVEVKLEESNEELDYRSKNAVNTFTEPLVLDDKPGDLTETSDIVAESLEESCSNSANEVSELLELNPMAESTESINSRCDNCGQTFISNMEKSTHSETCMVDLLKISEPVVMVDVEEDKSANNRDQTFTCEECGKKFGRKENLIHHKKLHADANLGCNIAAGDRPFHCSQCTSTFSRKEHLSRHMRTHTGEKHYTCGVCGKSFGRKDNVAKHMRTTHCIKTVIITSSDKVDPSLLGHKCDTCGRHFSSQVNLKRHISLSHRESDNRTTATIVSSERPVSLLEKALRRGST